jgi:hypothetical protein
MSFQQRNRDGERLVAGNQPPAASLGSAVNSLGFTLQFFGPTITYEMKGGHGGPGLTFLIDCCDMSLPFYLVLEKAYPKIHKYDLHYRSFWHK